MIGSGIQTELTYENQQDKLALDKKQTQIARQAETKSIGTSYGINRVIPNNL
jgi:hypothetical protein